jgi:hypothetical protein
MSGKPSSEDSTACTASCQLFRRFPWTFPRASYDPPDPGEKGIVVRTLDLLRSCPTWSCPAPATFPMRRGVVALRERWSHREVIVAAPVSPDYGNPIVSLGFCSCRTDLAWRILGPDALLRDLRVCTDGPREFPEELPWSMRPDERPRTLFLCHHEIRGD